MNSIPINVAYTKRTFIVTEVELIRLESVTINYSSRKFTAHLVKFYLGTLA